LSFQRQRNEALLLLLLLIIIIINKASNKQQTITKNNNNTSKSSSVVGPNLRSALEPKIAPKGREVLCGGLGKEDHVRGRGF